MLKELATRLKQGHRTIAFPKDDPPPLPERFRGLPEIVWSTCEAHCSACAAACPVGALDPKGHSIDLGLCLFCTDCIKACPSGAITFSKDYRLAVRSRNALVMKETQTELERAEALDKKMRELFGRSLKLRQVSAGGCNACEADVNVLTTIGWDLGRFGVNYVASPRHADGIIVTGPVSKNMELALRKTYDAVPEPKLVIAVGSCAIAGGPFRGHPEVVGGVDNLIPVDLYIPGCPPHPLTILDGLLRLLGKIKEERI